MSEGEPRVGCVLGTIAFPEKSKANLMACADNRKPTPADPAPIRIAILVDR